MRLVRNLFGLAIAVSIASLAVDASAQATNASAVDVEPPDYPPPSTRWKVAGVGLFSAGVFYGAAAGLSAVYPDVPGMKDLRIPVVGPWIGIANNGCEQNDPDCSQALVVIRTILMALDGAAQAGSLAVALEGVFMPTQEPAPIPVGAPRAPAAPPPPAKPAPGGGDKNLFFLPLPMTVGARGIGLGVTGRF